MLHVQGEVEQKSTPTPRLAGRRSTKLMEGVVVAEVTTVTVSLNHVATVADVTDVQVVLKTSAHNC